MNELTLENSFTEYDMLVTLTDMCKMLHISKPTAVKLIKEGKIAAIQCGKGTRYRISKIDVINYINEQRKAKVFAYE